MRSNLLEDPYNGMHVGDLVKRRVPPLYYQGGERIGTILSINTDEGYSPERCVVQWEGWSIPMRVSPWDLRHLNEAELAVWLTV